MKPSEYIIDYFVSESTNNIYSYENKKKLDIAFYGNCADGREDTYSDIIVKSLKVYFDINVKYLGYEFYDTVMGVYFLDEEIINKPDIMFLDFNETKDFDSKTYEGIVRKLRLYGIFTVIISSEEPIDEIVNLAKGYSLPIIFRTVKKGGANTFFKTIFECGAKTDKPFKLPLSIYSDTFTYTCNETYYDAVPLADGDFVHYEDILGFEDVWHSETDKMIDIPFEDTVRAHLIIPFSSDIDYGSATVDVNGIKTYIDCRSDIKGSGVKSVEIFRSDKPQNIRVRITPENRGFSFLRICRAYVKANDFFNIHGNIENILFSKTCTCFERTVAVLCDDRPGFELEKAERVMTLLRNHGYFVRPITVNELCTLRKERIGAFLIIPHACSVPAICAKPIDNYRKYGGLVFTLGGVLFSKYIDNVDGKWKEKPLADNEFDAALSGKAPIVLEGITPTYKTYRCNNVNKLSNISDGSIIEAGKDLTVISPVVRSKGAGFKMEHKYRFIPFLDVVKKGGRTADKIGTAAFIMLSDTVGHLPTTAGNRVGNVSDVTMGSLTATIGITEQEITEVPGISDIFLKMMDKMGTGLFIFEGGADKFVYRSGEKAIFGAKILNISQDFKKAVVKITAKSGSKTVYEFSKSVLTSPRKYTEVCFECNQFIACDYQISCELIYNGTVIDTVNEEIFVHKPVHDDNKDNFVKVIGEDFVLNNKKWYPFGVNYWPIYSPSIERNEYWLSWLDRSNYIPDEVEQDLSYMEKLGINSLFIRLDGNVFERCVDTFLDFLRRCRMHNFRISLSYPNATCPIYYYSDAFKKLVELFELADDPIIFSYDIAWEIGAQVLSPLYRENWNSEWKLWLEERYGSIQNAEADFGVKIDRNSAGTVVLPPDAELTHDGVWNIKTAAYCRFIEDYFSKKWNVAVRDMKKIDNNHLISYRRGPLVRRSMAFNLSNKHSDYSSIEGYYINLSEKDYNISCAHTALMRMRNGGRPVIWSEYGLSLTGRSWEKLYWDHRNEAPYDYRVKMVTDYMAQFNRMFKQMDVKGAIPWWWPGGFRTGEMSDNGLCGPDGILRPFGKDFVEMANWFKKERPIKKSYTVQVDPEAHARGYHYLCTNVLSKENVAAEKNNCILKAVTEATGKTSADVSLTAVGNTRYNGKNPPKYLDGEFNFISLRCDGKEYDVAREDNVIVPKNKAIYISIGAGNLNEAKWLSPYNTEIGGVYFITTEISDISFKEPIITDAEYLGDTVSNEFKLTDGIDSEQSISVRFEADKRAVFGEIFNFRLIPK